MRYENDLDGVKIKGAKRQKQIRTDHIVKYWGDSGETSRLAR